MHRRWQQGTSLCAVLAAVVLILDARLALSSAYSDSVLADNPLLVLADERDGRHDGRQHRYRRQRTRRLVS